MTRCSQSRRRTSRRRTGITGIPSSSCAREVHRAVSIVEAKAYLVRGEAADGYWGSQTWKGDDSGSLYHWSWDDALTSSSWRMRNSYSRTLDCVIVRLVDESGRVGWGEAKAPVAGR